MEKDKFQEYWWRKLEEEFSKQYMIDIFSKLKGYSQSGMQIYPSKDEVFKQFSLCDYPQVLVCFVVPEPILYFKQSKLWRQMSRWIELECFNGLNLNLEENPDYLLSQGIFTLSIIRTCDKNNKIDHAKLGWQQFSKKVIEVLNSSFTQMMFVYEDSCLEFMKEIEYHKVIKLEEGCFKQINQFLSEKYNTKINY